MDFWREDRSLSDDGNHPRRDRNRWSLFFGTALVAGMTMKQLGQVRGVRKQFGQ